MTLTADQRVDALRDRVKRLVPVGDWRALAWLQAGNAKYGEPFWIAEQAKLEMRIARPVGTTRGFWEALEEAREFWSAYEEINRLWIPQDPTYSIINAGTALSTTGDNLTTQAGSSGQNRQLEIILGGEATTSAVNRVAVQRAGTAITANTAITPEKFNSRSPAAGGTYGKAGTQALVGNPLLTFAVNAFGGFYDWKAAPGEELYGVNSEVISMRSLSGTSVVSSTIVAEEM